MDRYIEQLIADFNLSESQEKAEIDFDDSYENFEEQMLKIEEGECMSSKEKVGVSYDELPPADKMTDKQVERLLETMLNSLSANGTEVSFPGDGIPVKLAYKELREHFKDGFHAMSGWVIDFCSGWCPDCSFVDYCKNKDDIWTKEELENERIKNKG